MNLRRKTINKNLYTNIKSTPIERGTNVLDAQEYLHLAINATQNDQHHAALDYLHKALDQEPNNAQAMFLLAAEYAELGLYQRAIDNMEKSIELDPSIEMAYYQLALLYIQLGRPEESIPLWQHLSENAKDNSLMLFSKGIIELESNKESGIGIINQAIEIASTNTFLNTSMASLRDLLTAEPQKEKAETKDNSISSLMLSAYNDSPFKIDNDE